MNTPLLIPSTKFDPYIYTDEEYDDKIRSYIISEVFKLKNFPSNNYNLATKAINLMLEACNLEPLKLNEIAILRQDCRYNYGTRNKSNQTDKLNGQDVSMQASSVDRMLESLMMK